MKPKDIKNLIDAAEIRSVDKRYNHVWTRTDRYEVTDFDNEEDIEFVISEIERRIKKYKFFNLVGVEIRKYDYALVKTIVVLSTYADILVPEKEEED